MTDITVWHFVRQSNPSALFLLKRENWCFLTFLMFFRATLETEWKRGTSNIFKENHIWISHLRKGSMTELQNWRCLCVQSPCNLVGRAGGITLLTDNCERTAVIWDTKTAEVQQRNVQVALAAVPKSLIAWGFRWCADALFGQISVWGCLPLETSVLSASALYCHPEQKIKLIFF